MVFTAAKVLNWIGKSTHETRKGGKRTNTLASLVSTRDTGIGERQNANLHARQLTVG